MGSISCFPWIASVYWILLHCDRTCQVEVGQCVRSCDGIPDGHYASCDSCTEYVSCGSGVFFGNRPCTDCDECDTLYWDDLLKYCTPEPSTCIPNQEEKGLVGFWPLNCRYKAQDISGKGLSADYDTTLPTAPSIECPAQNGLSGAFSFAPRLSTDIISPVFLEVPAHDIHLTGVTWVGYIKLSQDSFTDEDAPIFAFEPNRKWTSNIWAGMGLFWRNSNIMLQINQGGNTYAITIGSGMTPNTWYKLAVRYNSDTGLISLRCSRLSDYMNTANQELSTTKGLSAFTAGRIRFGFLPIDNNGGNSNIFRGQLACVRLWNYGLSDADLYDNGEWQTLPVECTEDVIEDSGGCDSSDPCRNSAQVEEDGKEYGECVPTATSYFCQCPDGYRWEEQLTTCVDVDETLVGNCGCEDICTNQLVDRDGGMYQCSCTEAGKQLAPDGHTCIDQDEEMPSLKVWPLYGPKSGATTIDVQDEDLSGTLSVFIGSIRLILNRLSSTHVQITTLPLLDITLLNIPQDFEITLNGKQHALMTFTYMDDPVIAAVQPLRAIAAGGTILTVSGEHMDSVASPILTMLKEDDSGSSVTYTSRCKGASATVMTCPTPVVDSLDRHSQSRRRRRQAEDERELTETYIGFELDGVDMYRDMRDSKPDYSKVTVVMNPEIASFPGDGILEYDPGAGAKLDIRGKYMDHGARTTDYTIMVESEECTHLEMFSTSVSCLPPGVPPAIQQTASTKEGLHHVMVHVGYYTFSLGYLKYIDGPSQNAKKIGLYVGAAFGGVLVLVIIIVVCYCCCCRKRKNQSEKGPGFEDHHDFTFKKGMNMPPSLEVVDGTGKRGVKANSNGKKKDYYSNEREFDSDFDMKNRKKDIKPDQSTRYGPSPVKAGQDYEIFYNNSQYAGGGDYLNSNVEPQVSHDYLNVANQKQNDYVNIAGGNNGKDYMNMEQSSSSPAKKGNTGKNVESKKAKFDAKQDQKADQGYLAPAVFSPSETTTKNVPKKLKPTKKPPPSRGIVNQMYEVGPQERSQPKSSAGVDGGKHYSRSPSIDVASTGGNEAMKRAQQVFGEFKKPAKR